MKCMSTFFLFIFFSQLLISQQESEIPVLKKYSFGEAWFVEDRSSEFLSKKYDTTGVVNKNGRYFLVTKTLNQSGFRRIVQAPELKDIWLKGVKVPDKNGIALSNVDGLDSVNASLLIENLETTHINIWDIQFNKYVRFNYLKTRGNILIDSTTFKNPVTFFGARFYSVKDTLMDFFYSIMIIEESEFYEGVTFDLCKFNLTTHLNRLNINRYAGFTNNSFNKDVVFRECNFRAYVNFKQTDFNSSVEFQQVAFYDVLNLYKTKFSKGVDFRRCNFDSIKVIIFEKIEFPIGKLYLNWKQIKMRDHPIVSITRDSTGVTDEFNRLENVFFSLRDNYLAQGDKSSADDVKYELELRRDMMFSDLLHSLYGIWMGYGYQPWKYLFFLVIPIIFIFSIVIYNSSYATIYKIINNITEQDRVEISKIKRIFWIPSYKVISVDFRYGVIPALTRFWHSIFMSSSLLLGLRFKKEWIHKWDKKILAIATAEWILGIALYVAFALLIKSFRFDFIKGVFGL